MSKASSIGKAFATLLVIGGVGFGGWYLYRNYVGPEASSNDKVYVQKVSNVNTVTSADLFANSFPGVIVSQKSVDIKYDSTKKIGEILVANGDQVKKGDKLLTYDTEAIQIDIDTKKLEAERTENEIATNELQIKQYEEEKKKASEDQAVSYTNQILQLQTDNARKQYDLKAANVEITKLENSLKNAYVIAPINGTVTDLKDPSSTVTDMYDYMGGGDSDAVMKLTAEGDYRVKGVFNEQNSSSIYVGANVLIRSRVDDTTWKGTVSEIDTSPQTNNGYSMYSMSESDEQSTASKYAFYVEPESLEGFMLGQHILIDTDNGSDDIDKSGIWLYTNFVLKDGDKSYVWAKNSDKDYIEKRYVKIGQTDEDYGDCEILEGLSLDDYIAYPADYIKEGLVTTMNKSDKDIPDNALGEEDGMDEGMMEEGMMGEGDMDMEGGMPDNFVMNDDGSFSMDDENGNHIESRADGSMTVTSPDGGIVEADAEGNFIRGSVDDQGNFIFDYEGTGEQPADANTENGGEAAETAETVETEAVESEAPDLTFEDMYGISEDEFNAMSEDERSEFLKNHYKG